MTRGRERLGKLESGVLVGGWCYVPISNRIGMARSRTSRAIIFMTRPTTVYGVFCDYPGCASYAKLEQRDAWSISWE